MTYSPISTIAHTLTTERTKIMLPNNDAELESFFDILGGAAIVFILMVVAIALVMAVYSFL